MILTEFYMTYTLLDIFSILPLCSKLSTSESQYLAYS